MSAQSISTELKQSNVVKVLEMLRATPTLFVNFAFGKTNQELKHPLIESKRSLSEELAHLIHCEARTSEAILIALLKKNSSIVELHPEREWGSLVRFDILEFSELLPYFQLRRKVLLQVLVNLTLEGWSLTVQESRKKRQESVFWKVRALALHEHHHLDLIKHRLNFNSTKNMDDEA
jgi:DinB superfamily